MSFINVNASPVFLQYFVFQNYCFMTIFVLYLLFGDVREFYFINFSQTFKCPFTLQQDVIFSNALLPFSYPLTWINSRCWLVRVEKKGFSCLKENILRTVTIEMIGKFSSPPRPFSLYISSYLCSFSLVFTSLLLFRHGIVLINVSPCIYSRTKFYIY